MCEMHDLRAGAFAYQKKALNVGIDPYVNSTLQTQLANLKSLATSPVSIFFHSCGGVVSKGFEFPAPPEGVSQRDSCDLYAYAHFCQQAELLRIRLSPRARRRPDDSDPDPFKGNPKDFRECVPWCNAMLVYYQAFCSDISEGGTHEEMDQKRLVIAKDRSTLQALSRYARFVASELKAKLEEKNWDGTDAPLTGSGGVDSGGAPKCAAVESPSGSVPGVNGGPEPVGSLAALKRQVRANRFAMDCTTHYRCGSVVSLPRYDARAEVGRRWRLSLVKG